MKELLKSWKRSYEALESNPMNLDPGISAGYLACLQVCIQQLETAINEKSIDTATCEWSDYRKHYGVKTTDLTVSYKSNTKENNMSYNKKQNEVLDHWIEYPGAITKKAHLEMFLEEFNAVDPTPDPELYVIHYTDMSGHKRVSLECELSGHSKKEVEAKLIKILCDNTSLVVEYVRGDYIIADKDQLWKIAKL